MQEATRRAVAAAEATGTSILFGMRRPSDGWSFAEQLDCLRPGDVVTYCFRSTPHDITHPSGGGGDGTASSASGGPVDPAIVKARERGILFDVGFGGNAFNFRVAEAAIAQGFLPDTISSDLHSQVNHRTLAATEDSPRHDLLRVMASLQAAGMAHSDALYAVTAAPAAVLRMGYEIGSLRPGSCADIVALDKKTDRDGCQLVDAAGNRREVAFYYDVACVVRAGKLVT
jgi:dihydroorotase